MSDPAEYLAAAITRTENLARAADDGPWSAGGIGDHGWLISNANSFAIETEDSQQGRATADHIAAVADPEAVLRRCAAERKILDEHPNVNEGDCGTCVNGHWGYPTHGGSSPASWPCATIRNLAEGYGWTDTP